MTEGPTPPGTGTPPLDDGASPRRSWRDLASGRSGGRLGPLVPVGIGAAIMLAAVLLFGVLFPATPPLTRQNVDEAIASALASVTPPPAFSEAVYQAVQPSLVLIKTHGVGDPNRSVSPSPASGGEPEEGGLGSGVVVDLDGDILTSLHVVDGADRIELTFADGTTSPGEIVVRQPDHDIAVVRAAQPPPVLVPATLGNPGAVRPGMEAYALGSPFGLYGSVSAGVISGLDRSFVMPSTGVKLTGLFQIDAAVNPGNSGGALVDRDGRVIGIVTALINPTEEDVFIGIGLAVPIDVAGGAAGLPPY
jgi:S1-C subfamily serine protease